MLVLGLSILSVILILMLIVMAIFVFRGRRKEPAWDPAAMPAPPPVEPKSPYRLSPPQKVDFSKPPPPGRTYQAPAIQEYQATPVYQPEPAYEGPPEPVYPPEELPAPREEVVQMDIPSTPPAQEEPATPPARGAPAKSSMESLDELLRELQR